jgi:DNA-binding CsgD family transcriptional regulator
VRRALADEWLNGIVIVGPGGVGKTRLASEALAQAKQAGYEVEKVVATKSAAGIPLGALAPILPDLGDSGTHVFTATGTALAERGGGKPLVLHVDDAHLLDERSAALVHQLVLTGTIFAIVTVRTGETCEDAIVALWKDGLAVRLEIDYLDPGDTATLAEEVLGGPLADSQLPHLHHLTEGNALAVCELLLGAKDEGSVVQTSDGWLLADEARVPARLVDLIAHRLDSLDERDYGVLEHVALGEPLGGDALARIADSAAVARLERAGMIEVRGDGRRIGVWLTHPIHGQILRDRMSALRRREVLTELVAALGSHLRRRGDVLRVATWKVDLNDFSDPDLLEQAAHQAFAATDVDQTARLSAAAWEVRKTVAVGDLLGHVLCERRQYDRAAEVLAEAASLAYDDRTRTLVAMTRSENLFRTDRAPEAFAVLDEAEAQIEGEDWRAELLGHRGTLLMLSGQLAAARELVEPMLASRGRPFVEAAIVAGVTLPFGGQPTRALTLCEEAFALHQTLWHLDVHQSHPTIHYWGMLNARIHLGQLDQAQALYDAIAGVLQSIRHEVHLSWLDVFLAQIHMERGLLVSGAHLYRSVAERCIPHRRRIPLCGAFLAWAQHGDLTRAAAAEQALEGVGTRYSRLMYPADDIARGWVATHSGNPAEASRLFHRAAEQSMESGHERVAAMAWFHLARTGSRDHAEQAAEGMTALRPLLEGRRLLAEADFVAARGASDALALEGVAHEFEQMGAWLSAAESYAAAAEAHRDRRSAARAATNARRLMPRTEGSRVPLLRGLDAVADLTAREREVAKLAGEGLTAKQVAEALHLSKRTVENHLQRAYEKLGVRGRDELDAVLHGNTD